MSIGGIGQYGEQYGNLYSPSQISRIPEVSVETVRDQDKNQSSSTELSVNGQNASSSFFQEDTRSRSANLENISLGFNKGESYDYIGSSSDLNTLDMQQAISDMQKDQVLDRYNFFVGSAGTSQIFASTDGMVLAK